MQQNRSIGKKWFHSIFALLFVFTMLATVKNIQAQNPNPPSPTIVQADEGSQQVYLPITFANYCPDFFDDFSDPNRGWSHGENETLKAGVLDGEFQILIKNSDMMFTFGPPSCARQNYRVETDIRWGDIRGAYYGLVFGTKDDTDEFYSFEVNTNTQRYDVYHYQNKNWEAIYTEMYSDRINTGYQTNHLAVQYVNQMATLFINGYQVEQFYASTSGLTEAAVTVTAYSDIKQADVRFDNFSISTKDLASGGPAYSVDQPSTNQADDPELSKIRENRKVIAIR